MTDEHADDRRWALPLHEPLPYRQTGVPATPAMYVYPDERKPQPVLYGPKGEPMYRAPEPFGYCSTTPKDEPT